MFPRSRSIYLALFMAVALAIPMSVKAMDGCFGGCPPYVYVDAMSGPTACDDVGYAWIDWGTGDGSYSIEVTDPDGLVVQQEAGYLMSDGFVETWVDYPIYPKADWVFGTYTVRAYAENNLGSSVSSDTFLFDASSDQADPTTSASLTSAATQVDGWYAAPVDVSIVANDDCRVDRIEATLDSAAVDAEFAVDADGWHEVAHRAVDIAGKEGAWRVTSFGIDTTAPAVAIEATSGQGGVLVSGQTAPSGSPDALVVTGTVTLTADAVDDGSGVVEVAWEVDGAIVGYGATYQYEFTPGTHTVRALATDAVGNMGTSDDVTVVAL